jgi:hypothetical protein
VVSLYGDAAMFFRIKKSGPRTYLQIVESRREDGKIRRRVIATLGRLDRLQESAHLDALLRSGARFAEAVLLLSAHRQEQIPVVRDPSDRACAGLWVQPVVRSVRTADPTKSATEA